MIEYQDLVDNILSKGIVRQSQKPVKRITLLGQQVKYDLAEGFPLLTTRNLSRSWNTIVGEMLWIMSGSTNARDLYQYGTKLWDKWAKASEKKIGTKDGDLGPHYGHQLRNFAGKTDQLKQIVNMLSRDPNTGRAVASFWNLGDVETPEGKHVVDVAPCILDVHPLVLNCRLNLLVDARSTDVPLGLVFDEAQYALWLLMFSKVINLQPGELIFNMHDAHIYTNQVDAMKELLKREPFPRPSVLIADSVSGSIFDHRIEDFQLKDYQAHDPIKIPILD